MPQEVVSVAINITSDGMRIWCKPSRSRTRGIGTVLQLNLASHPAEASVQWGDREGFNPVRIRHPGLRKDVYAPSEASSDTLSARGPRLIKKTGTFYWYQGAIIEAE